MLSPMSHTGNIAVRKVNAVPTFTEFVDCWGGNQDNLDFTPMTVKVVEMF